MNTETFLQLPLQEVADLLTDKLDESDDEHTGVLVKGLKDNGKLLCLSVILSETPISKVIFEGENDE